MEKEKINLRRLDTSAADFDAEFRSLLDRQDEEDAGVLAAVQNIITDVRRRGDAALLEYTNRFDRREALPADLEISLSVATGHQRSIVTELRQALEDSAERIRAYHERQKQESWFYQDPQGNTLGQQVTPLDRVGVYVPGGKAAYPSSVLMNVIPARVAGVREVIMVVPCPEGEQNPLVLAAAAIVGVDRIFSIGGAQAIAALAFGTKTIPRVDKIAGPGNIYVATAKRLVFGAVGIDMIAGPSEVLIISDGKGDPDWTAMDLFAQAEHDELASALLISPDPDFLDAVADSIHRLLPTLEREKIIRSALENNGALILARDLDEAVSLANQIAPEHLELAVDEPERLLAGIRHAGAVFMGHFSAEVLGDYCAGPNHVLPTSRTARFSSPLGVYDFQKRSSVIMCTKQSVNGLAATASVLARGEGLTAHARSAEYRRKQ
ncbi:MAG: histidinol dehydrogenase [Gammaproteobacteria bacterium]